MTDEKPTKPNGCAVVLGLMVVVLAVGYVVGLFTGDDEAEGDREFGAFDTCTEFVRDRLRSPTSAEFRNYFEDDGEVSVIGTGEGPYVVRSSVDSQNAFGASLRSEFTCTVRHVGDGNWRLVNLSLD